MPHPGTVPFRAEGSIMKMSANSCRFAAADFIVIIMLCLTLVCSPLWAGLAGVQNAYAASSTCIEIEGTNSGANDYKETADPIHSYLTVSGSGYMRVQGYGSGSYFDNVNNPSVTDGSFDVIYYDSDFNITSHRHIDAELKLFGGFYESDSNFYIVSGQKNPEEDFDTEVFRVTKYDKNWNRLGSCGLYGANTTIPFKGGSCRIDGYGNHLAIRTCHEMFLTEDGLHHQASLLMIVDTDEMKVTKSQYEVAGTAEGYVSHSFNQFVKIGDGETAMLDHGDGYPRSFVLMRFTNDLPNGNVWQYTKAIHSVMSFPGGLGDNLTCASAGGLEITSNGYLMAGNAIYQHTNEIDDSLPRDVFVTAIDTSGSQVTSSGPVWLTDVGSGEGASTPHLVKISDNKFMVLWSIAKEVQYALVDGSGKKLSETYSLKGSLSDCQPIVRDGKVIWYKWKNSGDTFYVIPVDSPANAKIFYRHCGHEWEAISASNGTAIVKCSKCSEIRTVSYPKEFLLGYSTDNSYYTFGYEKAEVSLTDTVHFRGAYSTGGNTVIFDELNLEADSSKVVIDNRENTVTFTDEGTYTITARHKFDSSVSSSMTMVVEDPAHVWEIESAHDGILTYRCSHCGKTKQGEYPTSFRLGYGLDGYNFNYSRKQVTVDPDARLYFDGLYENEDGYNRTFKDFVLETDDPENAVVEDGRAVHFISEGVYTVTASCKYDPSVNCSMTVYVIGPGHEWELQSAKDGLATFVCTDCGLQKTEEYPQHPLMGYKRSSDPVSGCIHYTGPAVIDISETVTIRVEGYDDLSGFVIESDRPEDCEIDSETGTIKFKDTSWHEITVHSIYDPYAKDSIIFIVNKDLESVKLTANPAGSCALGTTVRLDAEEDGGWGHEVFTYTMTDPDGNESELYVGRMDDSDSRWCEWTPERLGTYKIHVSVYDETKPDIIVEDDMSYKVSAKIHESMPAEEYSIPNTTTSFGNELLKDAPGWEFDANELAALGHDLAVGETVVITARYTADDSADYDINETAVKVTRASCNHDNTVVEGAVEATCCEEGFSGDTICTDCGLVVKAGVVLPVNPDNHTGVRENEAKPAVWGEDGMTASVECTSCGAVIKDGKVIPAIQSIDIYEPENNKYNGKAKEATVVVMDEAGESLTEGRDYQITYEDNVAPGLAYVYIDFMGNYDGHFSDSFEIVKGDNPLAIKGKTYSIRYSTLKKKTQVLAAGKIYSVTRKGAGKMSYALYSAKKGAKSFKRYFAVNKTTGKLTVKKGLKKGTYKVVVKAKAAGNSNYKASAQKAVTITITVR